MKNIIIILQRSLWAILFLVTIPAMSQTVYPVVMASSVNPFPGGQKVGITDPNYAYINGYTGTASLVSGTRKFEAFCDKNLRNAVLFEIDHDNHEVLHTKSFKVRADVSIVIWKYTGGSGSRLQAQAPISQTLELDYRNDNVYHDKKLIEYSGADAGYKIEVEINNVTIIEGDAPYKIKMKTDILVDRYYDYDPLATIPSHFTFSTPSYSSTTGLLTVDWNYIYSNSSSSSSGVITRPIEYDLEWIHIDNLAWKAQSAIDFNSTEFKNKATRVTVKEKDSYYNIPMLIDSGYIIYRVRGKWRTPHDNYTSLVPGEWTIRDNACTTNCKLSNSAYPASSIYLHAASHEPKLNWQYSMSFAEDGKSKAVISYFDGGLRSRQTVEKLIKNRLSTGYTCDFEHTTRVSETFYDYLGRPAISTLPVPSDKQKIEYNRMFNTYTTGGQEFMYDRKYFDANSGACLTTAMPMSKASGASKYYSPSHSFPGCIQSPEENYIPDANLYPFTQTVYAPDNTGKVIRQGGLGVDYQIGSGRETKYFYAEPFQEELDRLFGNDVGYSSHYKKNMVVDANGQASVSYIDLGGKTIATNITGVAPSTMDDLDGRTTPDITVDLFAKTVVNSNELGIKNAYTLDNNKMYSRVLNTEFLVEKEQPYYFGYEVKGTRYNPTCGSATVCYNCVLDLNISLTDECGREYLKGINNQKPADNNKTVGEYLLTKMNGSFNAATACSVPLDSMNYNRKIAASGKDILDNNWASNDVTSFPQLSKDRNGENAKAYYFNGSNSYLRYGDILDNVFAATPNAKFSISGWANTSSLPTVAGGGMIISKSVGGSGPYQWYINHDMDGNVKVTVASATNGSNYCTIKSAAPVALNKWFHFVLVFDGSQGTASNRVKFYIDGTAGVSVNLVALGTTTVGTNQEITIGGGHASGNPAVITNPYKGIVDEVQIYNKALTITQINKLKSLAFNEVLAGLVAYWPLDGNTNDYSSSGFNATVAPGTVALKPGSYKINKTLTVNQKALDFYTDNYMKSTCLTTYDFFRNEELSKISTIGCEVTCDQCKAIIGDYDKYDPENPAHNPKDPILSLAEFNSLIGECDQLCMKSSKCQAAYESMVADMSPGGQYGEIMEGGGITNGQINPPPVGAALAPHLFKLSVFNVDNMLSNKSDYASKGLKPNWHFPYTPYLDELGEIDYILIRKNADGTYSPAVNLADLVQLLPTPDGNFKLRPQYLASFNDYYKNWKPSWAYSLVHYHPEYGYYEMCTRQAASNDFDDEWMNIQSYDEAETKYGSIYGGGVASFLNPLGFDPGNPAISVPAFAADPYFNSSLNPDFDVTLGEYNQMKSSMLNYMYDPATATSKTIWEVAYHMAACPNSEIFCYSNCTPFTFTFANPNVPLPDPAFKEQFWSAFKSLYLSLKQRVQERRFAKMAIESKYSYNGCIGADPFDITKYNFNTTPANNSPAYYTTICPPYSGTTQYYNLEQPCNWARYDMYKHKTQRFPGPIASVNIKGYSADLCYNANEQGGFYVVDCKEKAQLIKEEAENMADLSLYKQCGKCPLANDLELLLSAMLNKHIANPTTPDLLYDAPSPVAMSCNQYPELTVDLLEAFYPANAGTYPLPELFWDFSKVELDKADHSYELSGNFLHYNGSYYEPVCDLKLKFPDNSNQYNYTFNKIRSFCCIKYKGTPSTLTPFPNGNFEITAILEVESGVFVDVVLEGYTSCLDIATCSFKPICKTTREAGDLMVLFNILLDTKATTTTGNLFQYIAGGTNLVYNTTYPNIQIPDHLQYILNINLPPSPTTIYLNPLVTSPCPTVHRPLRKWEWKGNPVTASRFAISLSSSPGSSCGIFLDFPTAAPPFFGVNDLIRFTDLKADPSGNSNSFILTALVNPSSPRYIEVKCSTTCLTASMCGNDLNAPFEAGKSMPEDVPQRPTILYHAIMSNELFKPSFYDQDGNVDFGFNVSGGTEVISGGDGEFGGTGGPSSCKGKAQFYPIHGNYRFANIVKIVDIKPDPDRALNSGNSIFYVQMTDGAIIPLRVYSGCLLFTADPCRFNQHIMNGDFTERFPGSITAPLSYGTDLVIAKTDYKPNGSSGCLDRGTYSNTYGGCAEIVSPLVLRDHTQSTDPAIGQNYLLFKSDDNQGNDRLMIKSNETTRTYDVTSGKEYVFKMFYFNADSLRQEKDNFIKVNIISWFAPYRSGAKTVTMAYKRVEFDPLRQWHEITFIWKADAPNMSIEIYNEENDLRNYIAIDDISFGEQCPCVDYSRLPDDFYEESNLPPGQYPYYNIEGDAGLDPNYHEAMAAQGIDVWGHHYSGRLLKNKILGYGVYAGTSVLWEKEIAVEPQKEYMFTTWYNHHEAAQMKLVVTINGLVVQELNCGEPNKWQILRATWNANNDNKAHIRVEVISDNTGFITLSELDFKAMCMIPGCFPVFPAPVVMLDSMPCTKNLDNIITANARMRYKKYLDEIRAEFQQSYIAKCLNVYETFLMKYKDPGDHYTLYYYDQAGNLTRTIPPQGVNRLDLTKLESVRLGRRDKIKNEYTAHTYATTYKYNSLNQLVTQSVPDNDDMNIWSTSPRNMLSSSTAILNNITGLSFSSVYAGIAVANDASRGYIYKTTDNGKIWSPVNANIKVEEISDVYTIDLNNALALSSDGFFMRTTDGAATWDVKSTIMGLTDKAMRLGYIASNEVYMICRSGMIYKTADNGVTWTTVSSNLNTLVGSSDKIKAVELSGDFGLAVTMANKVYYTQNRGVLWQAIGAFSLYNMSLDHIQRVSKFQMIASGTNGALLTSGDNGTTWKEIATNIVEDIRSIYFQDNKNGWLVTSDDRLLKTTDGGSNWSKYEHPVQPAPFTYADQEFVSDNEAYILRKDGGMLYTTSTLAGERWDDMPNKTGASFLSGFTPEKLDITSTGEYICAGTRIITTPSAARGLNLYRSDVGNNWVKIIGFGSSSLDGIADVGKVLNLHTYKFNTGGKMHIAGVIIYKEYSVPGFIRSKYFDANITDGTCTVGGTIVDFTSFYFTDDLNGYASTENGWVSYTSNGGSTWSPVSITSIMGGAYGMIGGLWVEKEDPALFGHVVLTGAFGAIYKTDFPNSTNMYPISAITPPVFNGVKVISPYESYLLGEKGTIYKHNFIGGNCSEEISAATEDLYTAELLGSGELMVAGDKNTVFSRDGAGAWNNLSMAGGTDIFNNISLVDLYDFKFTTTNGKVMQFVPFVGTGIPWGWTTLYTTSAGFNRMHSTPSCSYLLLGAKDGSLYKLVRTINLLTPASTIKLPMLNDVQLINPNTVYAVGNNGTVIKSTNAFDANSKWSLSRTGITENLTAISFIDDHRGMVVGKVKSSTGIATALYTGDGGTNWNNISITGATTDFNDVQLLNNNFGIIVGNNKKVFMNTASVSTAASWTSQITGIPAGHTNDIHAVHFSDTKNGFAVGQNDAIYKCTVVGGVYTWASLTRPTSSGWPAAGKTFKGVYFKDNLTGYIVGTGGFAMRVKTDASATNFENITTYAPNPAMNIAMNDIKTIAYVNNENVFIGGAYSSGTPANKVIYKLSDGKDLLSTRFYYDRLGRIVASQNARQFKKSAPANNKYVYSYSLYDAKGRLKEVGEKTAPAMIESKVYDNLGRIRIESVKDGAGVILDYGFEDWIVSGLANTRKEVTRTHYDDEDILTYPLTLENTRNRVVATTYEETNDNSNITYDFATHYSYDIHGNVKTLLQEFAALPIVTPDYDEFKRTDYTYDLVSGNVNKVTYQEGKPDQFIHKYEYDEENKLTYVSTSSNNITWHQDARYLYYRHGPLARVEIGNDKVQGIDYGYTIQGWLKGINSNTVLSPSRDMGKDGHDASDNNNRYFAKDETGLSLTYYVGDYAAINSPDFYNQFESGSVDQQSFPFGVNNLYNGNISQMVTGIRQFMPAMNNRAVSSQAMAYRYDILNRIKQTAMLDNVDMDNNAWSPFLNSDLFVTASNYAENFQYDRNGNILSLSRNASNLGGGSNVMDNFTYRYYNKATYPGSYPKNTNKLGTVEESQTNQDLFDGDIETGQTYYSPNYNTGNYQYDAMGNLVKDVQEEIENIEWTVSGKIKSIIRTGGSSKPNLEFQYDAQGNRIVKIVKPVGSSDWKYTVYARDAQGNILSVYTLNTSDQKLQQQNTMIYGSSRLGEMEQNAFEKNNCGLTPAGMADLDKQEDLLKWQQKNLTAIFGMKEGHINEYQSMLESNSFTMDRFRDKITFLKMLNFWSEFLCKIHCAQVRDNEDHFISSLKAANASFMNLFFINFNWVTDNFEEKGWNNFKDKWMRDYEQGFVNEILGETTCEDNTYTKGARQYELTNHLGNVLTTISDRKVETSAVILDDHFSHFGWERTDPYGSFYVTQGYDYVSLYATGTITRGGIRKAIPTVPGESYKVTYAMGSSAASLVISNPGSVNRVMAERDLSWYTPEPYEIIFTAEGFSTEIRIVEPSQGSSMTIDLNELKIEKIAVVTKTPLNQVLNHTFSSGATPASLGWSSCVNATLQNVGDKFRVSNAGASPNAVCKSVSTPMGAGKAYHLRFNIQMENVTDRLYVQFGPNSSGNYLGASTYLVNGSGWHDYYFTPQSDPTILQFRIYDALSANSYILDDITIEEIEIPLTIDYRADTRTATDYYAFGSQMPERTFAASQNASAVLFQDFEEENAGINSWRVTGGWSSSPMFSWDNKQLHIEQAAYAEIGKQFATQSGHRYRLTIDLADIQKLPGSVKALFFYVRNESTYGVLAGMSEPTDLTRTYTLEFIAQSNSSLFTVSTYMGTDVWYNLDNIKVIDITDEFEGARFGFNGKENDDEIKGEGNQQDYGMRIYDSRLGKFLSVDPLTSGYPWFSPYHFAGNTPIQAVDLDGLEPKNLMTDGIILFPKEAILKNLSKKDYTFWRDMFQWEKSAQYQRAFDDADENRYLDQQKMSSATGDAVNVDYLAIKIVKLPKGFTEKQFYDHIRLNFTKYMGEDISLSPQLFDCESDSKWNSPNPVGSVMVFHATADDAPVICSKAGNNYWVFTPVGTIVDFEHPLAGQREFGLTNNGDGSYTFYTRGVDMMWGVEDVLYNATLSFFEDEARVLWNTVMNNVVNEVNLNGGSAYQTHDFRKEISWDDDINFWDK
jgi:RHS repeat-associated protein